MLSGRMLLETCAGHRLLCAGDDAVVAPGVPHAWRNAGETPLTVRAELRPALRFERLLRDAFAMMAAGGGRIDPARAAALMADYQGEYDFASSIDAIGHTSETFMKEDAMSTALAAPVSQWVRDVYRAVDARDVDACLEYMTDEATFRFGNAEPMVGKAAIAAGLGGFYGAIDGLRHHIAHEWNDGETKIVEAEVDYTRKDGRMVTVPVITVYAMAGDRVRRAQIFADLAPVFA